MEINRIIDKLLDIRNGVKGDPLAIARVDKSLGLAVTLKKVVDDVENMQTEVSAIEIGIGGIHNQECIIFYGQRVNYNINCFIYEKDKAIEELRKTCDLSEEYINHIINGTEPEL